MTFSVRQIGVMQSSPNGRKLQNGVSTCLGPSTTSDAHIKMLKTKKTAPPAAAAVPAPKKRKLRLAERTGVNVASIGDLQQPAAAAPIPHHLADARQPHEQRR